MNSFITVKEEHVTKMRELLSQEGIETKREMKLAADEILLVIVVPKERLDSLTMVIEPYGSILHRSDLIIQACASMGIPTK